jgi:hypothetical protein
MAPAPYHCAPMARRLFTLFSALLLLLCVSVATSMFRTYSLSHEMPMRLYWEGYDVTSVAWPTRGGFVSPAGACLFTTALLRSALRCLPPSRAGGDDAVSFPGNA